MTYFRAFPAYIKHILDHSSLWLHEIPVF